MSEAVDDPDMKILFLCGGQDDQWVDMLLSEVRWQRQLARQEGIEQAAKVAAAIEFEPDDNQSISEAIKRLKDGNEGKG